MRISSKYIAQPHFEYLGTPNQSMQQSSGSISSKGSNTANNGTSQAELDTRARSTSIRRRNRIITSCLECRRRKLKCDKNHPCANCSKAHRSCVYITTANNEASQIKLTKIKEKVGSLERMLERDVLRGKLEDNGVDSFDRSEDDEDEQAGEDEGPTPEEERKLEPTPLAISDAIYEGDVDTDIFDLGVQLGKMRVTERIGGYFRPKLAEEISDTLDSDNTQPLENKSSMDTMESFLLPGPTYIAPSSEFFISPGLNHRSSLDFLPTRDAADELVRQYFNAVHVIVRLVHKHAFDEVYGRFWTQLSAGLEPAASNQAVLFAAMFCGAVSMAEEMVFHYFGVEKRIIVDSLRSGCEHALAKANVLRSMKLETLQAFVMYLVPLCRDQVTRAHAALTSTAIRIAQCLGLHSDGDNYGVSAIETHVRRLIWCQLCCLDIRTCEAMGPYPTIRADDFDTRFPLNVNDSELYSQPPPKRSAKRWTDVTFSLIRFECYEMHRCIWAERPRVEKKEITVTSILAKVESFRKSMEMRYGSIIDERVPIQRAAKLVMKILTKRLYIALLHRYLYCVSQAIPERFRQLLITHGTELVECAIQLETDPLLSQWAWYVGAYQAWHTALMLVVEVTHFPTRREADRIWACCDYVFETDPAHTREQKAHVIFKNMRDRLRAYRQLRKLRAPTALEQFNILSVLPNSARKSASPDSDWSLVNGPPPAPQNDFDSRLGRPPAAAAGDQKRSEAEGSSSMDWNPSTGALTGKLGGVTSVAGTFMPEIDWNEWDSLFPPPLGTVEMNMPNLPPR